MTQPTLRWGVAGALLLSIAGCLEPASSTGSGGTSGGGYSGGDQANGGMGGSGAGTTSGYGSIIINGIRKFNIDNATLILDGVPLGYSGDDRLPIGVSVEYLLGEDVDENLSSGTALEVRATHQVIGPVTSNQSLLDSLTNLGSVEVLGQTIEFSDSDTHVVDIGGMVTSLNALDLQQGDVVAVSGFPVDGVLHATRIAVADGASEWQLIGRSSDFAEVVDAVTPATSFAINGQSVSLGPNGVVPTNCETVSESQKVRVVATPDSGFAPGQALNTVTSVECLPNGISLLEEAENVPADLPVAYSGIVSTTDPAAITGATVLVVDGQRIVVSDGTSLLQVVDGTISVVNDLLAGDLTGKRIDVDGQLREDGMIDADHVIILSPLTELLDTVVCDVLLWWLPGCGEPLVYTESPLNEEMLAVADSPASAASISVLGLEPETLGVDLGEVAPTKEFSRRVFAALESSASGTEPEQSAQSGLLVASLQ